MAIIDRQRTFRRFRCRTVLPSNGISGVIESLLASTFSQFSVFYYPYIIDDINSVEPNLDVRTVELYLLPMYRVFAAIEQLIRIDACDDKPNFAISFDMANVFRIKG